MKKKRQNGKRGRVPDSARASAEKERREETDGEEEPKGTAEASVEHGESDAEAAEELEFDEDMVEHLRMQTSLLEEREVSRDETIEMLRRVMRQHSLAREKRLDYIARFLKEEEENPP